MSNITREQVQKVKDRFEREIQIGFTAKDEPEPWRKGSITAEIPFDMVKELIGWIRFDLEKEDLKGLKEN